MAEKKKVEQLTVEQEALLPVYRDKGLAAGLKTGPCDRDKVIPMIKEIYKLIKRPIPEIFIFAKSPFEAQKIMHELIENDPGEVRLKKWTLESNDEFVADLIKDTKKIKTHISTYIYGYGSNESYWTYTYKYFRDVVGVEYNDSDNHYLEVFDTLVHHSGWHYLFDECAIICDRPTSIVMENNQLSNEEGPAVEFADGYKIWAIDGHLLNEQIIMSPETLTVKQIDDESNSETKRIMIERYGVVKYLTETGAEVLDQDSLSLKGSCKRILLEDKHGERWLIGSDGGTGRVYHMPVPNNCSTCREAHEAISGVSESKMIAEC